MQTKLVRFIENPSGAIALGLILGLAIAALLVFPLQLAIDALPTQWLSDIFKWMWAGVVVMTAFRLGHGLKWRMDDVRAMDEIEETLASAQANLESARRHLSS